MTVTVEIDERISKCRKILEQDPNSQIFAALAEAFRKKGDLEQAFRVCQLGLKVHPSYGSAHVVMAKINLDRGLYDWAEAEVKKAAELDGNSRAIELLLAEIHIYKGEFPNAIRLLKKLHQVDPGNGQIKKLLDIAMRLPDEQTVVSGSVPEQEVMKPAPASTGIVEAPPPARLQLTDVLQQALTIPELQGALFINSEGLVVESEWTLTLDITICSAAFAEIDSFLTQELLKASFGRGRTVLVETAERVFYLVEVDNGMFLFVGSARTNLGSLRMKIETLIKKCGLSEGG